MCGLSLVTTYTVVCEVEYRLLGFGVWLRENGRGFFTPIPFSLTDVQNLIVSLKSAFNLEMVNVLRKSRMQYTFKNAAKEHTQAQKEMITELKNPFLAVTFSCHVSGYFYVRKCVHAWLNSWCKILNLHSV